MEPRELARNANRVGKQMILIQSLFVIVVILVIIPLALILPRLPLPKTIGIVRSALSVLANLVSKMVVFTR